MQKFRAFPDEVLDWLIQNWNEKPHTYGFWKNRTFSEVLSSEKLLLTICQVHCHLAILSITQRKHLGLFVFWRPEFNQLQIAGFGLGPIYVRHFLSLWIVFFPSTRHPWEDKAQLQLNYRSVLVTYVSSLCVCLILIRYEHKEPSRHVFCLAEAFSIPNFATSR